MSVWLYFDFRHQWYHRPVCECESQTWRPSAYTYLSRTELIQSLSRHYSLFNCCYCNNLLTAKINKKLWTIHNILLCSFNVQNHLKPWWFDFRPLHNSTVTLHKLDNFFIIWFIKHWVLTVQSNHQNVYYNPSQLRCNLFSCEIGIFKCKHKTVLSPDEKFCFCLCLRACWSSYYTLIT